jgi:hypothetical protein
MISITDALGRQQMAARRQYIELLQHFDFNDNATAEALNRLRTVIGKTPEQVQADFAAVQEIRWHQLTLVDDGDSARAAQDDADAQEAVDKSVEAFKTYNAKWKASHQKLVEANLAAHSRVTQRGESLREARRALAELEKSHPDLFVRDDGDSTKPPHRAA